MSRGKQRELFGYEDIAAAFEYDPETGKLFRRQPDGMMQQLTVARERPDRRSDNTAQVSFRCYLIRCTHIMWMLMEHRWPREGHVIDHRDGDVFNNRWTNLREATRSQSAMNREPQGRWAGDNDLERGVVQHGNRYFVQIRVSGKRRYFGTFATKEEANEVARKAIAEHQGEFSYEASRKPKGLRRL
jgi:hypothetical protein